MSGVTGTSLTTLLPQEMHISGVTWLYQIIWVYREEELHHLDLGNTVFCISLITETALEYS